MSIKHYVRLLPLLLLFLIPNFSSAATESIRSIRQDCTGYSNCYTSLSAWEAGEQRDLTTTDEIAVARIEGTWTNPDTTAVTIDGWTTDATRYIKIYTALEARHSGVWDTAKYRLEVTNYFAGIRVNEDYVKIDGLQVSNAQTGSGSGSGITSGSAITNGEITITNSIVKKNNNNTGVSSVGIGKDSAYLGGTWVIANNIIYDFNYGLNLYSSISGNNIKFIIYNNTIANSTTRGILLSLYASSDTVSLFNNIIQGSAIDFFRSQSADIYLTGNNITQDATSPDTSFRSVIVSFADSANKNFHLSSSDISAKNLGADLSVNQYYSLPADIDGETRSGSWDIGADEDNSAPQGGGTPPPPSDTTASVRSGGAPSGTLAAGTMQTTLTLTTNENATCKYGTIANTAYASIANTFSNTGNTSHSASVSVQDGQSYVYYVRCSDESGNINTDDLVISFSVESQTQTQAPTTQTQTQGSASYYVSPTGAASWASCTGSTPLNGAAACSWQTAMANARAGDTVYFRGGTYEPGAGDPDAPKIYPANDGTANAPITFMGYPGETAIIHEASWNATAPASNTKPALGCYRNSYIVWDGFTFVRNLDNGYQASSIVKFESSDHCTLKNSELIGRPHIDYANGSLISIVQSSYIYIHNNKLHGMSRDPNAIQTTVNTTAIWSFNYDHVYIYNNDFYDNYGNINTKIGTSQLYIYNNHIWNCGYSATRVTPQNDGVTDISIYNNVIRNCQTALDSPDPGPGLNYGIKFYNNTIYNSGVGTLAGVGTPTYQKHRNTEIFNNIISNQGNNSLWGGYHNTLDSGAGFPTYMNYNDFHGTGRWRINYVDYSTLSAWQTVSGADLNSITSNPLFINPGGTNPEDYKLQSTSPARIGRGGSYASVMGAYVTGNEIIGYVAPSTQSNQTTDTTAPSIPTNLLATVVSPSQVNLTWSASTDSTGVTGYRIYRNGTQLTTTTGTSYQNTGLSASTLYTYAVLAYDAAGNVSSQSTGASATTQNQPVADTTAPTITNIASTVTTTGATISWTTNEAGTSRVEYGLTTSYGNTTSLSASLTSHSHTLSNLSSNTTYHYRVNTTDSAGNTATSQDRTFTTSAVADTTAPSSITDLTTSSLGQTSLTLSWTVPTDTSGIASYDIRYSTTPITSTTFSSATQLTNVPLPTTSGSTQTQYVSVGLTPNTTYSFAIKSTDAVGNVSSLSNIATGTTLSAPTTTSTTASTQTGTISVPTVSSGGGGGGSFTIYQLSDITPPKNPTNVRIEPTNTQATLSWTNPTDPDFVRVKIVRKTGSAVSTHTDGTTVYDGTGTTFTDTNLVNNQTYYYAIYAYDKVPNYTSTLGLSVTPQASLTQTNVSYTTIEAGCTETTTYSTLTGAPCTKVPTAFRPFYTFSKDRAITYGMKDSTDVRELQKILQFEGLLTLTSPTDGSFGPLTKKAVIAFQQKYQINPPQGTVGPLTKTKLNQLYGSTTSSSTFYRNLTIGSKGEDVKKLQQLLNTDIETRISATGAGSPGNETTYFGPATKTAVMKYQKKYNISPASGYVGPVTRGKLEGR